MMNDQFTTAISPNEIPVYENPPRFTWPMAEAFAPYVLEISQDASFGENTIRITDIPYNFYVLDKTLEPRKYFWRVNSHSKVNTFELEIDLPESPVPKASTRYTKATNDHPRLWLNPDKIKKFRKKLDNEDFANFAAFYKNSVLNRIEEGFPKEPKRYPEDKRVVDLWRGNYMTCQVAMCYIRSLSIAGVILEDDAIIEKAKAALLELAAWDWRLETGSTTRLYNDECCYRVGYGLAYGYDWLYEYLTLDERDIVFNALYMRTKEVAEYAIIETKIHNFPYDSHAVRSLSMMIIPCTIAMLDLDSDDQRHKDAQQWLNYAIDYLSTIYTPWGGVDGGWAEGPAYWTTGMAFVTEAINFVKNYLDINLFERAFFQKTGDFILNVNPPDTYYASFCDQSNQGDKPGPKTAFNMRLFAGITGNGHYQWYFNRIMERSSMAPQHFSDKGWWDLYYDDMVFNHDYGTVSEEKPQPDIQVKHFRDVGWVAINKNMADFKEHIFLLMKSSPYGSLSHSHADQNAFVLFAFGQPLIINSGYYIGYGTQMHLNWRKQTKSANTILIDGLGQYAGPDYEGHHLARQASIDIQNITAGENKVKQLSAKGEVVDVKRTKNAVEITADATAAYLPNVPYLRNYTRKIHWQADDTIVIEDRIILKQPGKVSVLLHALNAFDLGEDDTFTLVVEDVLLKGKTSSNSKIASITQSDEFSGVDKKEIEGLDKQYHLAIHTQWAVEHEITTTLQIEQR